MRIMNVPERGRRWVWALGLASMVVYMIYLPTLMRFSAIDLDDYVERGTFAYMLVHDHRWIVGALVGYLVAELHIASKGLFKEGKKELREWLRSRSR